ncbi:VanZ family protein [Pseudoflavonifractor sp. An85]|uniref:VanZ family protein n=1 Tax=Pseudoflavonifractor sp. An85 TaxID=1965661 RepID=UPI000B3768AA|nr:VanZ family protein [Pseudoflavonifractor sp. An85]OUN22681.1 hypothetical protein B5G37_09740 [Pseudoflavonifractor sp. An85]
MIQYAGNILSRITMAQWAGFIIFTVIVLLGDRLSSAMWKRAVVVTLKHKSLVIYTAFIFLTTIFTREIGSGGKLAWTPLWSWQMVLRHHNLQLLWQILLNILLFVPLGALLALNRGRSAKAIVLTGFGLSLCIELCQLVFRLGLFEWDDILHNGSGCVLGMLAARTCQGFLQKIKNGDCEYW